MGSHAGTARLPANPSALFVSTTFRHKGLSPPWQLNTGDIARGFIGCCQFREKKGMYNAIGEEGGGGLRAEDGENTCVMCGRVLGCAWGGRGLEPCQRRASRQWGGSGGESGGGRGLPDGLATTPRGVSFDLWRVGISYTDGNSMW